MYPCKGIQARVSMPFVYMQFVSGYTCNLYQGIHAICIRVYMQFVSMQFVSMQFVSMQGYLLRTELSDFPGSG